MIKRSLFQVHSPTTLILKYTYLILHLKYLLNIELINILKMHDHSNIPQFKHLLITDFNCTNYFYNKHIFYYLKNSCRSFKVKFKCKSHESHTWFSFKLKHSTLVSFLWPLTNPWPLNLSLTFDSPSCQVNKVHHRRPCHALSSFIRGLLDKCDGNNGMSSAIKEGKNIHITWVIRVHR